MKLLLPLAASAALCSCADMNVTKNYGSSSGRAAQVDAKDFDAKSSVHFEANCGIGAAHPRAIYVRPFCLNGTVVRGDEGATGAEASIRASLIPVAFADDLKTELSKLAPTAILLDNEMPKVGWLVDGNFTVIDGGSPLARFFLGHFGAGQSFLALHVRVTDAEKHRVIYEFDLAGGSRGQGPAGTARASGLGTATPFDLRNAAERVFLVLNPNVDDYGTRSSVTLR